ncbi:hypothetical protein [Niallia sp.]|nr:hypothetical protein [Niallia sp.]
MNAKKAGEKEKEVFIRWMNAKKAGGKGKRGFHNPDERQKSRRKRGKRFS